MPHPGTVLGADDAPLAVQGHTHPLPFMWQGQDARIRAIIVGGVTHPPVIAGYDLIAALDIILHPRTGTVLKFSAATVVETPPPPCSPLPVTPPPPSPVTTTTSPITHPIRLMKKGRVPSRSSRILALPNPFQNQECVLFTPHDSLHNDLSAVASASTGKTLYVKVINTNNHPIELQPGWEVGQAETVTLVPTPVTGGTLPPIPKELSEAQQMDLRCLLQEYEDIFAVAGTTSQTTLAEHSIHTHGPPIRQPQRRQNPKVRGEEERQVQEMLREGVIRPSTSPWASPVVLVSKKDATLRFCVDFRRLNDVTVKDAMPLPRIDDTLDALHGARWFSTLDLKQGYWQVPIEEQHKEKTAFRTSGGGLFEFNRMPFGLCNAPATFSRLMDTALTGLSWKICLAYLDDIIVFAATWQDHLQRLRQVFQRLREAGLRLHPDKCTLGAKQVGFLGHQVSAEGIRPDPSNIEALLALPPPLHGDRSPPVPGPRQLL